MVGSSTSSLDIFETNMMNLSGTRQTLFISFVPTVQHVAHIWWCPLVSTKTKLEPKTNFLLLRILLQLGKTPATLPSKNQHLETQWWLTVPIAKGKNLRLQSFSRSLPSLPTKVHTWGTAFAQSSTTPRSQVCKGLLWVLHCRI